MLRPALGLRLELGAKRFIDALELDDVMVGGGNVTKLEKMTPGCRAGDNALAFRGGFLLWEKQRRGRSYASR
jgi:hypothetical protein